MCATMKFLIVTFALVAAASSASIRIDKRIPIKSNPLFNELLQHLKNGNNKQSTAIANDYVDTFLGKLDQYMIENGLDPLPVPNINLTFEYKPLLITYHGELQLTNGWLQDTSTLHRNGDAILKYEHLLLNLRIPISFNDLLFDFDYSCKLMDLGPTGNTDGKVKEIQIYVDVTVDLDLMELVLQEFHIEDAGKISIKFHGNSLLDWLGDLLGSVASSVLHDTLINLVDGKLNDALVELVQKINEILGDVLS